MKTFRYALSLILGITITYVLQRWDRRRLSPSRREAAWNGATWGAALYAFGPLSMLGWVWVTRGDVKRWSKGGWIPTSLKVVGLLLAGALVAAAIVMTVAAVDWGIESLWG